MFKKQYLLILVFILPISCEDLVTRNIRDNSDDPRSVSYRVTLDFLEAEIGEYTARAYSANGMLMWTKTFPNQIADFALIDLNNDQSNEAIIGIKDGPKEGGYLYIIDYLGNTTTISPPDTNVYRLETYRKDYEVRGFEIDTIHDNNVPYAVITWAEHHFYVCILALVNLETKTIESTYWHPGSMGKPVLFKNKSGQKRIFMQASNNDIRTFIGGINTKNYRSYFVLDPTDLNGLAPPYFVPDQNKQHLVLRGSELWYAIIFPQGYDGFHGIIDNGNIIETSIEPGVWWYIPTDLQNIEEIDGGVSYGDIAPQAIGHYLGVFLNDKYYKVYWNGSFQELPDPFDY